MDATEQLHPNWQALATVHLPLKRFVREGVAQAETARDSTKYRIACGSGEDVRNFYEATIDASQPSRKPFKAPTTMVQQRRPRKVEQKVPFESNKYFRCAMENRAEQLQQFDISAGQLNATDGYGWTALMMAACEGATDAVRVLLDLGADRALRDKRGQTAFDLARKKGHTHVAQLLESAARQCDSEQVEEDRVPAEPFHCSDCQGTFTEATRRQHETSTLHRFNVRSTLPPNKLDKFNIPARNRGLQLMVKQGWDKASGLGPESDGRLYPVKTVIRKQRSGLGVEQTPARVTHFDAFDYRATQRHSSDYYKRKPRNRNDMRREKKREWKRERRLRNELS